MKIGVKMLTLVAIAMKKNAIALGAVLSLICGASHVAASSTARPPAFAGKLYPKNPDELRVKIKGLLDNTLVEKGVSGKIVGLLLPQATCENPSSQLAAAGYKMLSAQAVDTVVLIGSSRTQINGASIWTKGAWLTSSETPILVDDTLGEAIQQEDPDFTYTQDSHYGEFALESQLPFIQSALPNAKILPILVNDPKIAKKLAAALYKHVQNARDGGKEVLVVISSDMSSGLPEAEAGRIDDNTLQLLEKKDPEVLGESLKQKKSLLSSEAGVLTLLEFLALVSAEADRSVYLRSLAYAHSGDSIGQTLHVTGYTTCLAYTNETPKPQEEAVLSDPSLSLSSPKEPGNLSVQQQIKLLRVASHTLQAYLTTGKIPEEPSEDPKLQEHRGIFVTLRTASNGVLRGCMGATKADKPLLRAVQEAAAAAAKDSRFKANPITAEELPSLRIDVSVLSPLKIVPSSQDIKFGQEGVLLSQGKRQGLYLPEVYQKFLTPKDFLSSLCQEKAGLSADCWSDKATKVETFSTEQFGGAFQGESSKEKEPSPPVESQPKAEKE